MFVADFVKLLAFGQAVLGRDFLRYLEPSPQNQIVYDPENIEGGGEKKYRKKIKKINGGEKKKKASFDYPSWFFLLEFIGKTGPSNLFYSLFDDFLFLIFR